MYLQVINSTKPNFNQIRSTKPSLFKDIKRQGWDVKDCTITEMPSALVDNVYRGLDGKNIPTSHKQYKTRAKGKNNLNMKVNFVKRTEALVV